MSRYVDIKRFSELPRGTILQNKALPGQTFVVTSNHGNRATVVSSFDVTNLQEWQRFDMGAELETKTEYSCDRCKGTRQEYVDDAPMPCSKCCCGNCGVAPGVAHYIECSAVNTGTALKREACPRCGIWCDCE